MQIEEPIPRGDFATFHFDRPRRGDGHRRGLQGRYDRAYQQCMAAKGHQVPGVPGLAPSPPPTGLSPQ